VDEATALEERASRKNLEVPEFIKSVLEASEHRACYVVPADDKLRDLLFAIARIGNNVNQIARLCNTDKQATDPRIERLQNNLVEMKAIVSKALTTPPKLESLIESEVRKNPALRQVLLTILESHRV
jgi:hypothetical protein